MARFAVDVNMYIFFTLFTSHQLVSTTLHKQWFSPMQGEYAKFGMISLKVQTSDGPLSPRRPIRSPSVKGTPFQVVLQKGAYAIEPLEGALPVAMTTTRCHGNHLD